MNRRLLRSPDDRVLAGIAGGMAETYELDPALVRVGWALLILLTGGVFLVLYIVMAMVVPLRPETGAAEPGSPAGAPGGYRPGSGQPYVYRRRAGNDASGPIVIGLILIVAGAFFLARQLIPALNIGLLWPVIVICGGVLLILAAFARPRSAQ